MRNVVPVIATTLAAMAVFTLNRPAMAENASGAESGGDAELAQELSNPLADLMSIPFQVNYDRDIGPRDDGEKLQTNIQPVIPFSLSADWNLISRTIIPVIHQDDVFPGEGSQFGLGDINMEINGLNLNVLVEGEGEPVLLLHGFPDSNYLWRGVIPRLVQAGYRVIAPDQRGFGLSDAPEGKANYDMELIARDAVAVLDALDVARARLVAHDWGAMIGWLLAGTYPDRFESYTAISVCHPKAYASAGFEQKKKGWYVLFFQLGGIAEKVFMADNWSLFRKTVQDHPEMEHWIEDLSRPGRLTAGMNWYRANLSKLWKFEFPRVKIPVFGIWSTGDVALAEDQMIGSAAYVDAQWRYERLEGVSHWIPVDVPDKLSDLLLGFFR